MNVPSHRTVLEINECHEPDRAALPYATFNEIAGNVLCFTKQCLIVQGDKPFASNHCIMTHNTDHLSALVIEMMEGRWLQRLFSLDFISCFIEDNSKEFLDHRSASQQS